MRKIIGGIIFFILFAIYAQDNTSQSSLPQSQSYDLTNPKVFNYFYKDIYKEDLYPYLKNLESNLQETKEEFSEKEDTIPVRLRLSKEENDTMINQLLDDTRNLNLNSQNQNTEIANIWYAYWRLFNAWEDYIETYVIMEPLNDRAPKLPPFIYNKKETSEEETTLQTTSAGYSYSGPGGVPYEQGTFQQQPTTTKTHTKKKEEISLPPVDSNQARQLIQELVQKHQEQLNTVIEKDYQKELDFQAKVERDKAIKESYLNWKSNQTDLLIQHLEKTLNIKFQSQ